MINSNLFSSKALTAAVTALALTTQAVTFSSNASAHDGYYDRYRSYDRYGPYERRGEYEGYSRPYVAPRDYGRRDFDRRGPVYVEKRKKDHTGRAIAIGIGAVMLGAILASEASRR